MKLLLVVILIAGAQSAPRPQITVEEVVGVGRSINLPDGCNFISSTQNIEGNIVEGEYSYEDPIGSKITVTYQVNTDGSNYLEKRQINQGYKTEGNELEQDNRLTAEEVVRIVITELRPTVIKIIRATVLQADVDLNDYDDLVETILIQLKPVVGAAVNNALSTSPHSHLDANDLISRILVELRPFIVEAIRQEVANQQPKVTEEDIVKIVKEGLEDTVIKVVEGAVRSSTDTDLLQNQEKLVSTIMRQLRPVVLQAVQRALTASNVHGFNANTLTDRIIVELTPFVRRGVSQQVQLLLAQQQGNADKIVNSVIQDLRPIIVRIIRESVRNYKGDLSQYGNLVESILNQLRPVVLSEVKRALSTSSYKYLDAGDLTEKIMIRLRPFVVEGVEEQIRLLQQEQAALLAQQKAEQAALLAQQQREEAERLAQQKACANQVVQSVKTDLEPIIVRIIRQTVRNSNADLTQYDNLVQVIISQLRPVILNEVRSALSGSTRCDNLNANDLTKRIVVEITPFVRRALEEQIRELEEENKISADDIVDKVIAELKPIVIQVIRATVSDANVNLDDQEGLVRTIVSQLRPVVLAEVRSAIAASNANYDAQELANKIVVRLIPFVREGVRKEVQVKKTNDPGNIVQTIIAQLDPFIKTSINDALGSQTTTVLDPELSSSQSQTITSRIISQLTGRVELATNQYLDGSASSVSNNVVVENIIAQFQPQIIRAIEGDATIQQTFSSGSFIGSDAFSDMFGQIITALRGIILQQIRAWRASQVVVQPVPVAPVAPAGGSDITSIFGTGGANSVQVETPNYNYNYNHARSLD